MRNTLLALAALALIPACSNDETTVVNIDLDSLAPGTGVALSGGTLITFSLSAPGTILSSVPVSGIDPAYALVGIDFRPATKQLYGLAINSSDSLEYRLYAINPVSGATALAGIPAAGVAGFFASAAYGVDFNPVVDRLRVVNSFDENCRINPNNASLAGNDTDLTPAATTTLTACAYTNNVAGAATTTLYAIDLFDSALAIVGGLDGSPSPNGGVVTDVGPLGVTLAGASNAGFDITPAGVAYATLTVGVSTGLYTINLGTGAAALIGPVGSGAITVVDFAVAP